MPTLILLEQILIATEDILCDELSYLDSPSPCQEGSGWGTHIYLWRIHFDIWQN